MNSGRDRVARNTGRALGYRGIAHIRHPGLAPTLCAGATIMRGMILTVIVNELK
jgi:hypothetical protein